MKTKLILRTDLCPGDIIMLTAAVRDLHQTYPNQYTTDVRTPHKELWFHNPYITPLKERDPDVRVIDCHYPLIHQSNQRSSHFIQGYIDFLSRKLGVPIRPTLFRGEIFMSESERNQKPVFDGINLEERHIWLIVAGGKYDFTIVWFPTEGLLLARTAFVRRNNFPDKGMVKRQDDLLFGDCIDQCGGRLVDFGGIPEIMNRIRISCGQRRGTGEGGIGEGWLPVDPITGE